MCHDGSKPMGSFLSVGFVNFEIRMMFFSGMTMGVILFFYDGSITAKRKGTVSHE